MSCASCHQQAKAFAGVGRISPGVGGQQGRRNASALQNLRSGTLTAQELRGRALFAVKCSSCHATDLFTDESFRNNCLNGRFLQDSGRVIITFLPADQGRFKVPSLRNVALTAPYMHDGRLGTLAQVLAHYDHGMVSSPTLDPVFRQPTGRLGFRSRLRSGTHCQPFCKRLPILRFAGRVRWLLSKPQL